MSRITIGQEVANRNKSFTGTVVAIMSRGGGPKEYQCSYLNKDGDPAVAWMSGVELHVLNNEKHFGFEPKNPTVIAR